MARILIVDDFQGMCELLSSAVKGFGHESIIATSAQSAWQIVENQSDIHVVLLDLNLNNNSDGLDVAKKIIEYRRRFQRAIKICIVSGKRDRETVLKSMEMGCDDYIVKPVDLTVLKEKINVLLGVPASGPNHCMLQTDLAAKLAGSPIPLSFRLKLLSEVSMDFESDVPIEKNAQVSFEVPTLAKKIQHQGIFSCRVKDCVKGSDGKYKLKMALVGIHESILQKIRQLCMKQVAIAEGH